MDKNMRNVPPTRISVLPADLEFESKKKRTRKEMFLSEMDEILP
jgi:hypothetical protein